MTDDEVLREVVDALEGAHVPYMIVGSKASGMWGIPRATQDSDVVADLDPSSFERVADRLAASYYVPEKLARSAIARRGMFNVIRTSEGMKVDIIVRADSGYARQALARRLARALCGRPAWFASPEDTILAKLLWHRQGGGEMHIRDCAGIVRVQAERLERASLRDTAYDLGVLDLLESLLGE